MSAEYVLEALCGHSSFTAVFGTRKALKELPPDTDRAQKCLVYEVITDTPMPNVDHTRSRRAQARVRITVSGKRLEDVIAGHDAFRTALDFTIGATHAGKRVVIFRKLQSGTPDRDEALGIWWRPDDYVLAYYE